MFRKMSKIRPRIAILNAIFIALITSGARHYGDYGERDNLLTTSEIAALFLAGFVISLTSWIIIFTSFDFRTSYKRWRIIQAALRFLLITIVTAFIYILILNYYRPVMVEYKSKFEEWSVLCQWGYYRCLLINFFILIIKFSTDNNIAKREALLRNEMLQKENIVAKYEALKQQVNPHFLFNSLNSLKSLIMVHPERSVDFVIRLSDVYRYLLKHGVNGTVTLSEELEFLQSYIFLLERRYETNLSIEIDLPERYLSSIIPPVSLQILIENAVKHNVVSAAKPLSVRISIQDDFIHVENDLQPRYSIEKSEKIGLATLDHRYRLLSEKGVRIETKEKKFSVLLPLIYEV
ncbi:histidine kinase [Chitinophaga filiformis]|uniref:sensor histidine kinase n=1 Tax=Chitinophaga filiformis TaxID=104663 RepID=UPI001F292F24|nr:histidine kinase [Chitinophaga filiformis]MCF6403130.1 histidine kinase [Chitinophaga filiformis]